VEASYRLRSSRIWVAALHETVNWQKTIEVIQDQVDVWLLPRLEPPKEDEDIWPHKLRRHGGRKVGSAAASFRVMPHAEICQLLWIAPEELVEASNLWHKRLDLSEIAIQF